MTLQPATSGRFYREAALPAGFVVRGLAVNSGSPHLAARLVTGIITAEDIVQVLMARGSVGRFWGSGAEGWSVQTAMDHAEHESGGWLTEEGYEETGFDGHGFTVVLVAKEPEGFEEDSRGGWYYGLRPEGVSLEVVEIYLNIGEGWKYLPARGLRVTSSADAPGMTITVSYRKDPSGEPVEEGDAWVIARVGQEYAGSLRWNFLSEPPTVLDIHVEPQYRRQGVATALWEEARKHESRLEHSDARTQSGDAWIQSLGAERFTFSGGALRGMSIDNPALIRAAKDGTLTAQQILDALGGQVGTWWFPVESSRTPWTDATEFALWHEGLPVVLYAEQMPGGQGQVNDWAYTQTRPGEPVRLAKIYYSPGSGWVELDARGLRATAATVAKTAATVREEPGSPLPYDRYRVTKRISLVEGSGYHPDADIDRAKERQQAAYEKWRKENPGARRPERYKPERAESWVGSGYGYFTKANSAPGTVAFIDLEERGDQVRIAYMAVRPDQRGRGLARRLIQETYDRFPKAKIDWGKMMAPEVGRLYESFQRSHPEQTGSASVYYASLTKTADEDQCPFCSGDSLPIGGGFVCQDCGTPWHPDDPEAQAYHGDGPERGVIQAQAASGLFWRVHPKGREFSVEDATSTPWNGGYPTQQGYSCFASPWHLWLYTWEQWPPGAAPASDVIAFSGQRVGTGHDEEDLVVPDMRVVRRMSWDHFLTGVLPETPLPPTPKYAPYAPAIYNSWERLRDRFVYLDQGNPVHEEIIRRFAALETTALPSWRDRGARPTAEALIVPDLGRSARRNYYTAIAMGEVLGRRSTLAEAKALVEEIYGPLPWVRVPGDQEPHWDPVWHLTTEFNDSPYFLVVERLPDLGVTSMKREAGPSSGVVGRERWKMPTWGDFRQPREVVIDRRAYQDYNLLPDGVRSRADEEIANLSGARAEFDAKTAELRGAFGIRLTPKWRLLFYLGAADAKWHVFYIGPHDYREADRRFEASLQADAFKNWKGEERSDIKPNPDGTMTLYRTETRPAGADLDNPGTVGVHWTTYPMDFNYSMTDGDRVMWYARAKATDVLNVADRYSESEVVLKPGSAVRLFGRTVREGRTSIPMRLFKPEIPMDRVVTVEGRAILPDYSMPGHDPNPPANWPRVASRQSKIPGVTLRKQPNSPGSKTHLVLAEEHSGGYPDIVGTLEWSDHRLGEGPIHDLDTGVVYERSDNPPWSGRIVDIYVDPKWRRRGLATEMFEYARSLDPNIKHHSPEHRTEDGMAWSRTVGGSLRAEGAKATLWRGVAEFGREDVVQDGRSAYRPWASAQDALGFIHEEFGGYGTWWGTEAEAKAYAGPNGLVVCAEFDSADTEETDATGVLVLPGSSGRVLAVQAGEGGTWRTLPGSGLTVTAGISALGPLPISKGRIWYRVHYTPRRWNHGPGPHSTSAPFSWDHWRNEPNYAEFLRQSGYSAFDNPRELVRYMKEMGWSPETDKHRVVIFTGTQIATGRDGEPLVQPDGNRNSRVEMTWKEFRDRLKDTPERTRLLDVYERHQYDVPGPTQRYEGTPMEKAFQHLMQMQQAASLRTAAFVAQDVYRAQAVVRQVAQKWPGLEAPTALLRKILTDAGFPQGDQAEAVNHPAQFGKSSVAWDIGTQPPIPLAALSHDMTDELTLIHEAAHIIRNGPSYAGRQGDPTIAHDRRWMETFHDLVNRYGSAPMKRRFNIVFGDGKGGLSSTYAAARVPERWWHVASPRRLEQLQRDGHFPADYRPNSALFGPGVYLSASRLSGSRFGEVAIPVSTTMRNPYVFDKPVLTALRAIQALPDDLRAEVERERETASLYDSQPSVALPRVLARNGYDGMVFESESWRELWAIVFDPTDVRLRTDDEPVPYTKAAAWLPTGGMFAPGQTTLDPRIFEPLTEKMRADVREPVLAALGAYWDERFGEDWRKWAKVYLAGSGASYWWDSDRDMDILIGVDLDLLREQRPANLEVSDADVVATLNAGLRSLRGLEIAGLDVTFYVNPGSYDIRNIKPYAAYSLTDDEWVVHPPRLGADWDASDIDPATLAVAEAYAEEAQRVLAFPEPQRTEAGVALFNEVKALRQQAYSPAGIGWLDPGNVTYQYLSQHPDRLLRRLYLLKHPEQALETAASVSDYGGRHQPDSPDEADPIWDLGSGFMPPDTYDRPQQYPQGDDREVQATLRAVRGKPEASLTIYRALPSDQTKIEPGNWVTISRAYAKFHGNSGNAGADWHVVSATVKAKDVYIGDGNSLAEYGYWGPAISGRTAALAATGAYFNSTGGTIYRGVRVVPDDAFYAALTPYEEPEQKPERRSAKAAEILLAQVSQSGDRHSTGLGVHWTERPEFACNAAAAGGKGVWGEMRVVIEATYTAADVEPEGSDAYGLGGVWMDSKTEAEVLIKPGARLRVTGLWVPIDPLGSHSQPISVDRCPKATWPGGPWANILGAPAQRTASSDDGLAWDPTVEYRRQGRELSGQEFEDFCQRVLNAETGKRIKIDFDLLYGPREINNWTHAEAAWDPERKRAYIGWSVAGLNEVVALHECAHVLAQYRDSDDDHGPYWRGLFLGLLLKYIPGFTASKTAMPVGPPPAGVRYLFTSNSRGNRNPTSTFCMLGAFLGDQIIGYMDWGLQGRKIQGIWVKPEYRRRRIAETMLNLARQVDPNISHHVDRTDAGDAWARAISPDAPARENNTTEGEYDRDPGWTPGWTVTDRFLDPRLPTDVIDLTPGAVAASKTAGANGDLPDGLTFEITEGTWKGQPSDKRFVQAFIDGRLVGSLAWWGTFKAGPMGHQVGEIIHVDVSEGWRRRGIATAMFERARQEEPRLHHSHALTDDGRAWSRTTSALQTSGLYWRVHDRNRPFAKADATSTPMRGFDADSYTEKGYSCFENPWHLYAYVVAHDWHGFVTDNDDVVAFSGKKRRAKGIDGEDLVVPDLATVRKMSWADFERELVNTPRPADTRQRSYPSWGSIANATRGQSLQEGPVARMLWDEALIDAGLPPKYRTASSLDSEQIQAEALTARVKNVEGPWWHGASLRRAEEVSRIGFPASYRPTDQGYGPGLYLTNVRATAEGYADRLVRDQGRPGAVIEIEPNLKNPFVCQYGEPEWDVKKAYPDEGGGYIERLVRHGHDALIIPFRSDTWCIVIDPSQVSYVSHEPRTGGLAAAASWTPFQPPAWMKMSSGGDAVPGGYNGYYLATDAKTGEYLGNLDYQSARIDGEMYVRIAMVEVDVKHRRKGVATVLLQALRHDFPGVEIDPGYTTSDGTAWWAAVGRTAGAKGDLPRLTYKHLPGHLVEDMGDYRPTEGIDTLVAYEGSRAVGHISWMTREGWTFGGVDALGVDPAYQRRGIATELLRRAREIEPEVNPRNTPWFTDDGEAWVGTVASKTAATARTFWHVTDRPNFTIDPQHAASGGPEASSSFRHNPGLWVTPNPELWHYLWRPMGQVYAAEIDVSRLNPGELQSMSLGVDDDRDQWFIPASALDKVTVKRVVPVKQAETAARRDGFGFALLAFDVIERGRLCVINHKKGWADPTALCNGVTDGNPVKWTTTERAKQLPICPECRAKLR